MMMMNRDKLRCKKCKSLHTYYRKGDGMRVCFKCGHQEKVSR